MNGAARRTSWQLEADRRWPDAMDMVEAAYGNGRWATVAWCAGLTVQLHRTRERAQAALAMIDGYACGHGCWRDHELVDLAEPETHDRAREWARGEQRAFHARTCRTCTYVFYGKAPDAALERARTRQGVAA